MQERSITVAKLGTAVTIAYASTYYLPAILSRQMAASLGVATSTVFLAFSVALLVSALLGPWAGRLVDAYGGRRLLAANSFVFAAGLAALAAAQGIASLFVAWLLLGIAMAAGFYEVAFSTLVRIYGRDSRSAITGITLIAGFASTIGWPLTAWLEARYGWRGACLAWAGIHLLVALPLNLTLPQPPPNGAKPGEPSPHDEAPAPLPARGTAGALAFVFGATWFVSTAMAAHLPALLQANGVSVTASVVFASLVGPAQVTGRLLEHGLLRKVNPLVSARLASVAHATGAAIFLGFGVPAGAVFALLHGAGNGIMTIANGTLPLVFFGARGYGARQGLLMMPARFAQAGAPYFFGLALAAFGPWALLVSMGLGVAAWAALMTLRVPRGAT